MRLAMQRATRICSHGKCSSASLAYTVGATAEEMKAECARSCIEIAPPGHLAYQGPAEVIAKVFAREPILWTRLYEFQARPRYLHLNPQIANPQIEPLPPYSG